MLISKNVTAILIIFLFLVWSLTSYAQTNVSGDISSNTTWFASNNVYVVTGDINVLFGITLTIEAGVIIKFQSNTSLIVNGTLDVQGTSSNPIVFTSYRIYIL
ncbi:MAG: hypothetical protein ACW99Q_24240 [Candidatus Kariarchaeaceae archaeon]|jgi:hypothetical protein